MMSGEEYKEINTAIMFDSIVHYIEQYPSFEF